MKTTPHTHKIRAPFVVMSAAVVMILLACGLPAKASKSIPERPVPAATATDIADAVTSTDTDTDTAVVTPATKDAEAKAESATPMRCPTRFCGSHRHHHGHYYIVCYGDHDHEYYCPGHD